MRCSDDVICMAPPPSPDWGVAVLLFRCRNVTEKLLRLPLMSEIEAAIDLGDNQKPDDLCEILPSCQ